MALTFHSFDIEDYYNFSQSEDTRKIVFEPDRFKKSFRLFVHEHLKFSISAVRKRTEFRNRRQKPIIERINFRMQAIRGIKLRKISKFFMERISGKKIKVFPS